MDVARKVMGDAPIAYVEGAGGTRVAEEQIVAAGKNDVSAHLWFFGLSSDCSTAVDFVVQGWTIARGIEKQ
jgi:hypothetical protein